MHPKASRPRPAVALVFALVLVACGGPSVTDGSRSASNGDDSPESDLNNDGSPPSDESARSAEGDTSSGGSSNTNADIAEERFEDEATFEDFGDFLRLDFPTPVTFIEFEIVELNTVETRATTAEGVDWGTRHWHSAIVGSRVDAASPLQRGERVLVSTNQEAAANAMIVGERYVAATVAWEEHGASGWAIVGNETGLFDIGSDERLISRISGFRNDVWLADLRTELDAERSTPAVERPALIDAPAPASSQNQHQLPSPTTTPTNSW